MLFENIYFKFLCMTKHYHLAEKAIQTRPSLKKIRYLSQYYEREKNLKNLKKLAEKACTLYPNNKFGFDLINKLSLKQKKTATANKDITSKSTKKTLEDIISPDAILVIYSILKTLSHDEVKNTIKALLQAFSESGGIDIKKIGTFTQRISSIALKRRIYIKLHKAYPTNHTILLRLSEIFQDDGKIDEAYVLLCIASKYSKEYIPIKKFIFELENGMTENAEKTFLYLMQISTFSKFKYLPMLKRVSAHFSSQIDINMFKFERDTAEYLTQYTYDPKNIKEVFSTLIKLRMLNTAENLIKNINYNNKKMFKLLLDSLYSKLGCINQLIEIANKNEKLINPIGINSNNELISYDQIKKRGNKCVEFYIPSVFFNQSEEKPTYATICTLYKNIYSILHSFDTITIVPFHQFNWRNCPQNLGEYGISYHTHTDNNNPHWLHIQEAVLNNCCSFDSKGFAGFSSLASQFSVIDEYTKNVSQEDLEKNLSEMHKEYIDKNVSKYTQKEEDFFYQGKYIFIPMQVRTDIVTELNYIQCIDLLRILVDTCPDSMKIVVKRHPFCKSLEIEQEIKKLEDNKKVIISDCSIHSLIRRCEAVFTANSGTGLEALMHEKPVYTTGYSEYLYATSGLLKERNDIEQIWKQGFSIRRQNILRFLYYYNKSYVIKSEDKDTIKSRLLTWLS